MKEHEKTLQDYINDPLAHDNEGPLFEAYLLGNSERANSIYNGRIRKLNVQIANFKKLIEECERKMESGSTINIAVLRETINGIFDFMEQDLGLTEVELRQNYYWSIADDALYTMEDQPKELDVGSLRDDWEFVVSSSKSVDQQIPIMFIHIAPLLQALSEAVPSYTVGDSSTES